MTGKARANCDCYRETYIPDAKGTFYYLKTGNAFTKKVTPSKKIAMEWVAQGKTVLQVTECTGEVTKIYNAKH